MIVPDVVIPVDAVMAPVELTLKTLVPVPTDSIDPGTHVPIPTLPFMTLKADVVVKVVPIPTLPLANETSVTFCVAHWLAVDNVDAGIHVPIPTAVETRMLPAAAF